MDAGFNPEELRGTRTGVYIGLMTTEANDFAEGNPEKLTGYETIGSTRAMLANRLSYAFNFSGLYGAPSRTGKIKDIASFDAEFFGIHSKLANVMDPQLRMLLELTHESIMDGGFNPEELRGTRTGVYIGLMTTEANDFAEGNPEKLTGYETIGSTRAMLANRLSYAFNFSDFAALWLTRSPKLPSESLFMQKLKSNSSNGAFLSMYEQIHSVPTPGYKYRGFTIQNSTGNTEIQPQDTQLMINNGSILEILLDLALENLRPDHVQMLDLAENLNLSLDIKNIIDQKPRKTVRNNRLMKLGSLAQYFTIESSHPIPTGTILFHIVLVDKPLDKFGKLLKQETEVAVICVHPGEVFVKEDGLVEVSRMTSGGLSYSLLYRAAPWQKTTTMITVTPGKFDWVPRLQEWVSLKYTDIILINSTESEVCKNNNSGQNDFEISLKNDDDKSLAGHKINGRVLYPAAGYMTLVWKALSKSKQEWFENVGVRFEDLRFLKPTVLSPEGTVRLKVTILPSSGRFEITENDAIVVEGKVQVLPEQDSQKPLSTTSFELTLPQEDIYKELNLRGYNYEGLYQGLVEANTEGTVGRLDWNNDWTSYIDTVLQFRL
ncbi:fatty acid synthase-like [Diaphorina citri]|uniref:Fatty acid synthase-like n=1 Tax=Diaphorina citri TaxID=121845 RepID=A0A1S4E8G9_DIACI|nr:fatty acid synthase-like [Diaphorina citri]